MVKVKTKIRPKKVKKSVSRKRGKRSPPRRKYRHPALDKYIMGLIAIALFAILTSPHQVLDARGRQFKGILPPKEARPVQVAPPVEEEEPVYPDLHMVVNIPARKVMLYDEGKEVIRSDIAVGQPRYKTPTGVHEIKRIIWNPWWIPPNSPWARGAAKQPPGPRNCLGPVKMMMQKGIRLHGTNRDSSVGRAASHGCLRMHNNEARNIAWYMQKRINNSDNALLKKYKKYRRRSFHVNLEYPVSVDIIYKPIELRDNIVYIYSDIYGWARDVKTELIDELLRNGINIKKLDAKKIKKLKYPRGRNYTVEIKLSDLFISRPRDSCVAVME